ncbi:MAG: hypothetical protein WC975_15120 [Phycisphaerae bacterium]
MSGIYLNEDNSHFFIFHPPEEMTVAGLNAWVDQYANTQVRQLMLCVNGQRTTVDSKVRQPVWDGFDPEAGNDQPFFAGVTDQPWPRPEGARAHFRRRINNALLLHQRGLDPYRQWIERSRMHGISPWISSRMNDVHFVDEPENCIHDRFWKEHPEYRRAPWRKGDWFGHTLDYGRPEVRAFQMAYLREMVFRYDLDGLELDWMRFGQHFKPGAEEEGCKILTEFVADVRRLLDERQRELKHPIRLGVRVPSRPDTARGLGMDAVTWARRGLIDVLVATPFLFIEFDMPIELWKQLLDGTKVSLSAGLDLALRPYDEYPSHVVNLELVCGAATSLLHRGADSIYLFNYMDKLATPEKEQAYRRLLREVGSIETMSGKSRRHVVNSPDHYAPGEGRTIVLPRVCKPGEFTEFRIPIGPVPQKGQRTQVRLATKEQETAGPEQYMIRVNGEVCGFSGPVTPKPPWKVPTHAFDVPNSALQSGYNVVEIQNTSAQDICFVWMEIAVSDGQGAWSTSGIEVESFCFWPE